MKRFVLRVFARWTFMFFYFAGLTALIPYVITAKIPHKLLDIEGFFNALLIISLVLFLIGVLGMYLLKGDAKIATRSLGYATVFPVVIAVFILIFGDNFIIGMAKRHVALKPFVGYLLMEIPTTGYLIISYLVIGFGWFWLSRKLH